MECSAEKMGFCDCCTGSLVKNAPPLVSFSPEAGCELPMIRTLRPEWREQSADGHGGKLSWWQIVMVGLGVERENVERHGFGFPQRSS